MKRMVMSMMMGALLLGTAGAALAQNEINERQRNQQKRIGEGVENGSLTAGETARLEKQEAAIHNEVKQDRKANGGTLTAQERRQVTRQQNRESKRIYRQKHDGQHR
jgi:methionine-rich copper-binding protein CopC